eukprot:SAG25_NODE_434_length_8070_cov_90.584117_7_plen_49_part_00
MHGRLAAGWILLFRLLKTIDIDLLFSDLRRISRIFILLESEWVCCCCC